MNEWNTFIKNFVLSVIEYADNKITQKLAMEIKFMNGNSRWGLVVCASSLILQKWDWLGFTLSGSFILIIFFEQYWIYSRSAPIHLDINYICNQKWQNHQSQNTSEYVMLEYGISKIQWHHNIMV